MIMAPERRWALNSSGLPAPAGLAGAGAGGGVSLAEATYATTTATMASGMTCRPSEDSSRVELGLLDG